MLQARGISVGYSEHEDRVLLACMDGERMQNLWLTRRVTARLLKSVAELLEKSSVAMTRAPADLRGEVIALEHLSAISDGDKPRPGGKAPQPAGLTDLGAVLVRRLDVQITPHHFRLVFHAQSGPVVELTVGRSDVHRLLAMLDRQAGAAAWGVASGTEWLDAPAPAAGSGKMAS